MSDAKLNLKYLDTFDAHESEICFTKREFSASARMNGLTVSSLAVCAEKPDIRKIETVLKAIADSAPDSLKSAFNKTLHLETQLNKKVFYKELSQLASYISKESNRLCWTPPSEYVDDLLAKRLISNDGIQQNEPWLGAIAKQISTIRLCHLRQISKKGNDLNDLRHFDAHLQGKTHPSYRERIKAAHEVLTETDLFSQAKEVLANSMKHLDVKNSSKPIDLYVIRPIKDYTDTSNSYNFLTATYVKLLSQNLELAAQKYYPHMHINIYEKPVMMLTKTNRTDASPLGRILKQPLFEVTDIKDKNVIIADDHVNAGAFTASLFSQIEALGGRVVGIASFSRHPNSEKVLISSELVRELTNLYPKEDIDMVLNPLGLSVDTLTRREGLTLLSMFIDGNDSQHKTVFESTMQAINGAYAQIIEGIGDDLESEVSMPPKTPQMLMSEIKHAFASGPVR
jgi:hypothetical protein